MESARYAVMAPNLLCVAGAFAFGLTGMAAVIISNFGTSIVYGRARRSLRTATAAKRPAARWHADDDEVSALTTELRCEEFEVRGSA